MHFHGQVGFPFETPISVERSLVTLVHLEAQSKHSPVITVPISHLQPPKSPSLVLVGLNLSVFLGSESLVLKF